MGRLALTGEALVVRIHLLLDQFASMLSKGVGDRREGMRIRLSGSILGIRLNPGR
jgi:hypothetical protein